MAVALETMGEVELFAGAAMLYAAGRSGVEALVGRGPSPGKRAIAAALPIGAASGVAVWVHEAGLALAIIFASSVAALSLVGGFIALMGSSAEEPAVWPGAGR